MKRRITALFLSLSMIVGSIQGEVTALAAAKNQESASENSEVEVVDGVGSFVNDESTYDEQELERIRATDIPIEGLNVDYLNVDWGDDETGDASVSDEAAAEHQIVLVLDTSGSMGGTPITQLRKSCINFVDDILAEDPAAEIGIVTYESDVTVHTFGNKNFTNNRNKLRQAINSLYAGGGTAMNAGLMKADEILKGSSASQKYIIQMADGEPNEGEYYYGSDARYSGDEYIDLEGNPFTYSGSKGYHSAIYETFSDIKDDYNIFSMGFFHSLSGTSKQFAGVFMNDIQNQGYTEVINADDLSFSFEDIANNIGSEHLVLNKSSLTMNKGDVEQLTLNFLESYTSSDKTVTWRSNNENVAVVSDEGLVTAVGMGTCQIVASAGGYSVSCTVRVGGNMNVTKQTKITVYQNEWSQTAIADRYKLAESAVITLDGTEYTTNDKGVAKIPEFTEGEIKVSKSGYKDKFMTAANLEATDNTVWLEKESDNPIINAVWVEGKDALHQDAAISLIKSDATTITADIDWGNSSYRKIELKQKNESEVFPSGSMSTSLVLKDKFDICEDIYIIVEDAAGHSLRRKIKISCDDNIEGLNGKIDFGDGMTITLPESWPLVGGTDVGLDLDGIDLPLKVAIEDGKIKGTLGIASYKEDSDDGKTTKILWKELKNTAKKNDPKENKKLFEKIKSSYGDAKKFKKKVGVSADIEFAGYIEGYIDDEKGFVFLDGGILINASAETKWHGQAVAPVIPIPLYWQAQIKGELEVALGLEREDTGCKAFGKVKDTIGGGLEFGVGLYDVLSAGGGGELNLIPSAEFKQGKDAYFELTVTLQGYAIVKLAIFEKRWDTPKLYGTVNSAGDVWGGISSIDEFYDADSYTIQDLSYIGDGRIDELNETVSGNVSNGTVSGNVFNSNSYKETTPQIVALESGTAFASWVDCRSTSVNGIHVYYSFYDGHNWSDPEIIDDDGTPDFSPSLATDGIKAYVVWQDMNRSSVSSDTVDGIASAMDIKAAVYNPDTKSFTVKKITDGNDRLDMMPKITATSGGAAVAFVQNKNCDWFANDGSNVICVSTYSDSKWSEAEETIKDLNMVNSLTVDMDGEDPRVAYTLDMDKDPSSIEDKELYLGDEKITDNEVYDSEPFFYDGKVYYVSGGSVMYYDPASKETKTFKENLGTIRNVRMVKSGDNAALLFRTQENLAGVINAVMYDEKNDAWGDPIALTETDADITSFDAWWNGDKLELLCNSVALTEKGLKGEVGEDSYGATSLYVKEADLSEKLAVENVFYNGSDIAEGCALPMTIAVRNDGGRTINNIKADLTDDAGNTVDTVDFYETILPGTKKTINYSYLVSENSIGKTYSITCSAVNENGTVDTVDTVSDNKVEIELEHHDIGIESLKWGAENDDNVSIFGVVKNNGFKTSDAVGVSLIKGSEDGDTVDSFTVDSLEAGEEQEINFRVPYENGAVYYVKLSESEEEKDDDISNNSDFVLLVKNQEVSGRKVSSLTVSKKKCEYTEGDTLNLDDISVEAEFDDASKADVTVDASIDVSAVDMNKEGDYVIKVSYEGKTVSIPVKVNRGVLVVAAKQKFDIKSYFRNENVKVYGLSKEEKKLASVNKKGIFRGKKAGTVSINGFSVKGKDAEVLETNTVIIEKPQLSQKRIELSAGSEKTAVSQYLTGLTKLKPTSYESSKESVITVDKDGNITPVAAGKARVTINFGEGKMAFRLKLNVVVK